MVRIPIFQTRHKRAVYIPLKVINMVEESVEQNTFLRHNGFFSQRTDLHTDCKYCIECFSEDKCVMQAGTTSNDRCSWLFLRSAAVLERTVESLVSKLKSCTDK